MIDIEKDIKDCSYRVCNIFFLFINLVLNFFLRFNFICLIFI